MKPLGLLAALLMVGMACLAEPLSDELARLSALTGDEKQLVDAARRFHLQQEALIEWDLALADQYLEEGKSDLAQTKREDLRHRIALMGEAWQFVLSHHPNSARANNYFGEYLYDHRNDIVGGVRSWTLAVSLDEDLSAGHNNLGIHYFHVGDYDQGLRHLGRALELEPKNPDYLYNLAQMYLIHFPQIQARYDMSLGKIYKEAMRLSGEAARFAPEDFDVLQDYAVNFYAAENFGVEADWKEAAMAWKQARTKARTKMDIFYTLLNEGRAWIRAEQWEKAVKRLEEALEKRPESAVVKGLLEKTKAKVSE